MATSVEWLKAWYLALDDEFEAVIREYSEDELQTRQVDRGHWSASAFVQFQIYREAVLIFFAKAIVYLRALQKPLSDKWLVEIG